MRVTIIDTETTGLGTNKGHRLIEIACLEIIDRKVTGRQMHYYVNPGRPVDPGATQVHGITDQFLADKPKFETIVPELKDFLKGSEIVAHNLQFDREFIDNELMLAKADWRLKDMGPNMCTLRMAWYLDKVEFKKGYKLDDLKEKYRVDMKRESHGALLDCQILAEVYLRMTAKWYM